MILFMTKTVHEISIHREEKHTKCQGCQRYNEFCGE